MIPTYFQPLSRRLLASCLESKIVKKKDNFLQIEKVRISYMNRLPWQMRKFFNSKAQWMDPLTGTLFFVLFNSKLNLISKTHWNWMAWQRCHYKNKIKIKTTHWLTEWNDERMDGKAKKIREIRVIWQIFKVNDACYSKQTTHIHTTISK